MDTTYTATEYGGRISWTIDGATSGGQSSDPPPGQELSVRTNRATLAFRKYYEDVLRGSGALVSGSPRRSLDVVA